MRNIIVGAIMGALATTAWEAVTYSQSTAIPCFQMSAPAPALAYDIPKADIDTVLKTITPPFIDQQIRVVDVGKYNLAVGIVHRGQPSNDRPDTKPRGPFHDDSAEVYIVQSGGGVLTTGPPAERKLDPVYNHLNGPTGYGEPVASAAMLPVSRRVVPGDIIIIPPGVVHAWTQVTDHLTYLSVRPDPGRVLPAGYVHPSLLKNQVTGVK
jgi:oxalate decarboxylase/phosphoglucose isomerase-like protein (cupin superfamily)